MLERVRGIHVGQREVRLPLQQPRHHIGQAALIREILVVCTDRVEEDADRIVAERRPEKGTLLAVLWIGLPWLAQEMMPPQERSPQSAPAIAQFMPNPPRFTASTAPAS